MDAKEIISELKKHANPKNVEGMARFGINPKNTLGISIPFLRAYAKKIGRNHSLALKLWKTDIHEAKILAALIEDPKHVNENQMETWIRDFDSWDVCDQVISNVFDKTPVAYKKAVEWSKREREFEKRAGFVMMAVLAVHDKKAKDEDFIKFFLYIKKGSTDERNFVRKAVNWALRQIGKRNRNLNRKAIALAEEIKKVDNKAARWIANDAMRELKAKSF